MLKIYTSTALLCLSMSMFSQQIVWQKDIESSTQDFLNQVITTIDQQYLITGSSIQSGKEMAIKTSRKKNPGFDFHAVKLNQQGEKIWEKFFSGDKHDFLTASVATEEGGFLLAGTSFSGKGLDKKDLSNGGSDVWIIKIDELGNELWQKTLGNVDNEEAKAVIQTTDLGFFIAANRQSSNRDSRGYGAKDVFITRLDKNGKILSEILLGGKGVDEIEKMIPTKDGGALLGIYSRSNPIILQDKNKLKEVFSQTDKFSPKNLTAVAKQTDNYGEGDYWIVKLDKSGKIEWEKTYGGNGDDHLKTLTMTVDGYIIAGESRSDKSGNKTIGIEDGTDLWIIGLNERGEERWQKSYNFNNRDILMGVSVLNSNDSKFSKGALLGGYTQSEGNFEKNDETFWIMYIDTDGNEQWRKYIEGDSRKKVERLSDLKLNKDGSIILAGTSATELGEENWKIVKLSDKKVEQLVEKPNIRIYPNPVSDYTYVDIGYEFKEADIVLYDMSGKNLQRIKTRNKVTKINTQQLIQGAYLINIKTDNNFTASSKLIKQ